MTDRAPKSSRLILIVGLLLVIPLLLVLGRGLSLDPNTIRSPLIGQPAPAFELPRLADNRLVHTKELRGKPLVLNFWATWCASCPMEHPILVEAARYYGSRVSFVGVAYNDKNETIQSWLDQHGGATYPTLVDINGKAAISYGVYGVPETYVIDPEGVVRFKHTGPVNPQLLQTQIEGLL
ncbi:MAG: DsbE family thiol:disulfide interchange protein [Myxococcota bacterium]|nr:DsbE family thiol:disulfide interchange protein [Myxococcota bacterium]